MTATIIAANAAAAAAILAALAAIFVHGHRAPERERRVARRRFNSP